MDTPTFPTVRSKQHSLKFARWLLAFATVSAVAQSLVAAGEADIYPRAGETMEWDTAAGHAVLKAAGGNVTTWDGAPFRYGKPGFRNGPFIARGL